MSESSCRVLFLCTGNSARSQMAEGLLRSMSRGLVAAFSAGTDPRPLHPLAVKVMDEVGIDISGQQSKSLGQYVHQHFDFVIAVCARAADQCPKWPDARDRIRWSIEDPSGATGTEEEKLAVFRRIRHELNHRIGLFVLANKLVPELRIV